MEVLTFSIPVFNDENTIVQLTEEIFSLQSELPPFKILIINDGSTDHTLQKINELKEKFTNIEIVNHPKNLGFGPTIAEIVKLPNTEWIAFLSGDHQFSAKSILSFLEEKGDADFILGIREDRKDSWVRLLKSKIYNKVLELYVGTEIGDINSIFLCKSILFKTKNFKSDSAFIHAEIVLHAMETNAKIKLIKIEHNSRKFGNGSGGKLSVIIPTIIDLFRFVMRKL